MNVLSLFDGMSCGQIALEKANVKVDNYFSSEIDKYAIQITQKNYPKTIQLGDVTKIKGTDLPKIDLLIGGSPCQSFSSIGKGGGFNGKSGLFYEYVRLLQETKPKYFLLENVKMKKEYQNIISNELGVEPIEINSSLVSAQNRIRLYWSNIIIEKLNDKNIYLDSILQNINIPDVSDYSVNKYAFVNTKYVDPYNKKEIKTNKSTTLRLNSSNGNMWIKVSDKQYRRLTPIECERLQNVPDNYTEGVSNTQRYKMIGNGWTVDVISHIFNNII